MGDWWSGLTATIASSMEKVYEVLDAPVNLLAGEGEGAGAGDRKPDATEQQPEQPEQQPERQPEQQSADAPADPKHAGGFAVISAIEAVYHEGRKLADTSLEASKKWAEEIKRDVETSAVLYQGLEIGESLISSSLSVLETVGKNAAEVMVQERNRVRAGRGRPASTPSAHSPSSAGPASASSPTAPAGRKTFAKLFEDLGMGHLQALEMLAAEAEKQAGEAGTPERAAAAQRIEKLLNFESDEAEIEAAQELLLVTSDGLERLEELVRKTGLDVVAPCAAMRAAVLAAAQFADGITGPALPSTPQPRIFTLLEVQQHAVQTLATFCGKTCEQLLRLAEHFLMLAPDHEAPVASAEAVRALVFALLKEISSLTSKYDKALQALGERQGCADAAADVSNGVVVDGSDALFHVQDAARHVGWILRRRVQASEAAAKGNSPATEAAAPAGEAEPPATEATQASAATPTAKAPTDAKQGKGKSPARGGKSPGKSRGVKTPTPAKPTAVTAAAAAAGEAEDEATTPTNASPPS